MTWHTIGKIPPYCTEWPPILLHTIPYCTTSSPKIPFIITSVVVPHIMNNSGQHTCHSSPELPRFSCSPHTVSHQPLRMRHFCWVKLYLSETDGIFPVAENIKNTELQPHIVSHKPLWMWDFCWLKIYLLETDWIFPVAENIKNTELQPDTVSHKLLRMSRIYLLQKYQRKKYSQFKGQNWGPPIRLVVECFNEGGLICRPGVAI